MSRPAASTQLLLELQRKLSSANVVQRLETLKRVTDIFLQADRRYSDEQVDLFNDLFHQLIAEIEDDAKATLAEMLCEHDQAPKQLIRTLAFDDDIRIAGPVLTRSTQLDDSALSENARTKSQLHLLAIATRKIISFLVTDILLQRGNEIVLTRLAGNPGAALSEAGYAAITERASTSAAIASSLLRSRTVPRQHLTTLIARASTEVRNRLNAAHPNWADAIEVTVSDAAKRMETTRTLPPTDAALANSLAHSLHVDGRLDETQVIEFIEGGAVHEAVYSLACLARVKVSTAQTLLAQSGTEGVFVLAKVAGFRWTTVRSLVDGFVKQYKVKRPMQLTADEQEVFEQLRESTAQQVLRFYRLESATSAATSD